MDTQNTLPAKISALIIQVDDDMKTKLASAFAAMSETAQRWMAQARALEVTDVTQVQLMAEARAFRIQLRDIRTQAASAHRSLKAPILPYTKALDSCERVIRTACEEVEAYLLKQERFAELKAEEEKRKLTNARIDELAKIGVSSPIYSAQAESLNASQWSELVQSIIKNIAEQKARDQAAKEAEAARAAEARRLAEENRALREQNELIAKEKAASDRALSAAKLASSMYPFNPKPDIASPGSLDVRAPESKQTRGVGCVTVATWRTTNDKVNASIRSALQSWAIENEQLIGFTVKMDGFTDAFVAPSQV